MTDYRELKRLADAANAVMTDVNITMAVGTAPGEVKAVQDFLQLAMPKTVLTLIAEIDRLTGIQPEAAPRPPGGSGLPRYGIRWNGPDQPLTVPMVDGYWTPWHLAADVAELLEGCEPGFSDVERLCKVLGYLGVSTPESMEESCVKWLSLVRTLLRTAETSKLLRQDAATIAEYERLKAENEALRADAERYRFVSQLHWYVQAAATVYNVCNVNAQWSDQRGSPDTDDIESAIDKARASAGQPDLESLE